MKTSTGDVVRTEQFLQGELAEGERLFFEARLLVDDRLRLNLYFHKRVHRLIRLYHRRKVKDQLQELHIRLFSDPANTELRDSARLFKS